MKLINNKEFLRNAANYIDVMNTLGGGIIETQVAFEKRKKGALIRVKAPGLNYDAFRVNLAQNHLTISAVTSFAEKESWVAPIFHQEFVLPPTVALDRMRVVFTNGELQVRLPYFETNNRQLPIETEDEE